MPDAAVLPQVATIARVDFETSWGTAAIDSP
jgi:hypothetical protein